jgi:hypothetical protein
MENETVQTRQGHSSISKIERFQSWKGSRNKKQETRKRTGHELFRLELFCKDRNNIIEMFLQQE